MIDLQGTVLLAIIIISGVSVGIGVVLILLIIKYFKIIKKNRSTSTNETYSEINFNTKTPCEISDIYKTSSPINIKFNNESPEGTKGNWRKETENEEFPQEFFRL